MLHDKTIPQMLKLVYSPIDVLSASAESFSPGEIHSVSLCANSLEELHEMKGEWVQCG